MKNCENPGKDKYNPFKLNPDVASYKPPVLRIIISALLIAAVFFARFSGVVSNRLKTASVSTMLGLICAGIFVYLFYLIIISLGELLDVKDNKRKANGAPPAGAAKKAHKCKLEDIIALVDKNDIIEVQILSQGKIVYAGASACSDPDKKRAYDKEYYIGKKAFKGIDDFRNEIGIYAFDGMLTVYKIDGLSPKHYKLG